MSFDFYDDWEAQEEEGWGNDELDRLLAGNDFSVGGGDDRQPGRRKGMSYGGIGSRRKTGAKDEEEEHMVPSSSMFGFLERLPFKIGGKGRRYKPSAADLQDVGEGRSRTAALKARASGEDEPLISESESEREERRNGHGRKRSGTVGSRETNTSLSSRGDLFPSEDEDDAVPLDDEFAMVLARRNTQGTMGDETGSKKRPGSTKTKSSKSSRSTGQKERRRSGSDKNTSVQVPSVTDLKEEEDRLRDEEETGVERERQAARKLAAERGLLNPDEMQAHVSDHLHLFAGSF